MFTVQLWSSNFEEPRGNTLWLFVFQIHFVQCGCGGLCTYFCIHSAAVHKLVDLSLLHLFRLLFFQKGKESCARVCSLTPVQTPVLPYSDSRPGAGSAAPVVRIPFARVFELLHAVASLSVSAIGEILLCSLLL